MEPREIIQLQMKIMLLENKIRDYSSALDGHKDGMYYSRELEKCRQEHSELCNELERKKQRASSLYWQTRFMNVV